MVPAQIRSMDQVRIILIIFFPLIGQRLDLILNLIGCLFEILFSGLLNDLKAQHLTTIETMSGEESCYGGYRHRCEAYIQ